MPAPIEGQENQGSFVALPAVGTTMTVLAGLSFLVTCMFLPLVGKAGTVMPYARQNHQTFVAVLMVTLLLAAVATWSKMQRRKVDQGPFPFFTLGLFGCSALLLAALFMGLLKI